MLEKFTIETFSEHLGGIFRIDPDGKRKVDVELISATGSNESGSGGRPFSLVFRGPGDASLSQRIYRIEHDQIGSFELFLVPIGTAEDEHLYEAVFT